ncbi:MAG: tetratricopeptide repeat protein [Chloroflexota bacterium]
MKKYPRVLVLALMLSALIFQVARADVAPPEAPPGSNPLPGEGGTQVAMLAETVILTVLPDPADAQGAIAKTVASFTMRNQGTEMEQIQVRFPLSFVFWGSEKYPEIKDLTARVNGIQVATTRQVLPYTPANPMGADCVDCPVAAHRQIEMPWAVFDVGFAPGDDVSIEVSYTVQGFGYFPYEQFRYILETGAGWKDAIGSADVIVRLPYEASDRNVWVEASTSGLTLHGNEVRWHFENLEPTSENNIEISLLPPAMWQKVLTETANVTRNPQDGEAWGRLGKAYKEAIRMPKGFLRDDTVGQEMYALSRDAYERCLVLLPKDSLWHAGYADLLWSHYYFDMYFGGEADTEGVLPRLLSELRIALELDPNNQVARDLLSRIASSAPELVHKTDAGYDFLALTATPTPQITHETLTAAPTGTPFPSPLPVTLTVREMTRAASDPLPAVTPTHPQEAPASPLCGGTAMLLPVLAGALWFVRRRQG